MSLLITKPPLQLIGVLKMPNAERTKAYWAAFRRGKADTLLYGLINMDNGEFLRERFDNSGAYDYRAYRNGMLSVKRDYKTIEGR